MHIKVSSACIACAVCVLAVVILAAAWPAIAQSTTVKPVITRNIDTGDRQELYARTPSVTILNGRVSDYWCGDPVPAGKRLVIEQLAAKAMHSPGDEMLVVFRGRDVSGAERDYAYLPLAHSATTTGGLYHVANQAVTVRLSAGMTPCFIAMRSSVWDGDVTVWLTHAGYYVEAP